MLNYAKAIGANTDVVSAQAFIFERDNHARREDTRRKEGRFIFTKDGPADSLLIIVIAGVGDEAFTTIRKAGLEAEDLFFADFENIAQSFAKLCQSFKKDLSSLEQFSAVLGFIDKGTLYIEKINDFLALLLRKDHTVELTKELENEKLISGVLEEGDRVLFLSPVLTESEDNRQQDLIDNLIRSQLDNLESEVETFILKLPKSDPIAAVLVEKQAEAEDADSSRQIPANIYDAPGPSDPPAFRINFNPILFLRNIRFRSVSRKRLILLVVFAVVLIFIGLNLLLAGFKKDVQFKAKLDQSQQKYDQAIAIKDADPNQAKTLLSQAKAGLREAQLIKPNDKQAKDLEQKLNEGSFLILKQYDQKDFLTFLDLNLIKANFAASRLSLSLGKMAVLDTNTKSLVVIDLAQKQPQILAGPLQLGDIQFVSINGDYVYAFSKDKGILKIDAGNGKTTPGANPDSEWQKIVDILGFANNVYLLDEFKNQIWKYIATDSGLSARNQYLREGETADFAAARNLEIDGSVWVLKSDNTILKFTQGAKDFFQLGEVDPPLDEIKNFYLADDTDNIYFLDNDNSRVVITNKKGEYIAQYSGEKFKTAVDLVVDEKGKKLYLLDGGKIYQVDLR